MWGKPYVTVEPLKQWGENAEHGAGLVELCERLFVIFYQKRGESPSPTTTDSGIVVA